MKTTKTNRPSLSPLRGLGGLLLLIALLCAVSANAQQRKKVFVAVIGAMEDPVIGEMLADEVMYAFSKSLLYTPLERTDEILAVLNRELAFQRSEGVLESNIVAMAKKYGAAYACIVKVRYSSTINSYQIAGTLVDVQTTETVHSAPPHRSPLNSEQHITKSANLLAEALGRKTDKELAEEERQAQEDIAYYRALQAERDRKEREQKAAEEKRLQQMKEDGYTEFRNLAVQLRPTDEVSWGTAQDICSRSRRGGSGGWRLPTVGELSRLYDNQSAIFGTSYYFNDIKVWTSNTCDKGNMVVGRDNKKECLRKFARCICVRDIK